MGRARSASIGLLAVALLACTLADGMELVPHRSSAAARSLLLSYQQPSFWGLVPQQCYRGQYGSPFRLALDGSYADETSATFSFKLYTVDCPVQGSHCCGRQLDHLLLRIGHGISITAASLDGAPLAITRTKRGVRMEGLSMLPSPAYQVAVLQIRTDTQGITNIGGLCPGARYPGGCDYIAYSADQTCCPEAAALPALLLKPLPFSRPRVMAPPPPPPPPHPQGPSAPLPKDAPPAPRTSATLPPAASPDQQQQQEEDASPPPVQHAAGPRPEEQGSPSPGGEMQGGNEVPPASPAPGPAISPTTFCVEDLTRSPFRLMWAESSATGFDTTFTLQLWRVVPVGHEEPAGIPHPGDCSSMDMQALLVQVDPAVQVRRVMLGGRQLSFTTIAEGATASWLAVELNLGAQELGGDTPLDLAVTVRGDRRSMCPASEEFRSAASCEFVVLGSSAASTCCTHGVSRKAPALPSCLDDAERSPYLLEVAAAVQDAWANTTRIEMQVGLQQPAAALPGDPYPEGDCGAMSLANVSVEIKSGLTVLEALVDGRAVDVGLRPATGRSAWLTFSGLGAPAGVLGAAELPRLTLLVAGLHDSACAASDLFPSGGGSCQYVVQGRSGRQRCCNRGISRAGTPEMGGCDDDLAAQPFRLMYDSADRRDANTTFNYVLHTESSTMVMDGHGGNCSSMAVQALELEIFNGLQVVDVTIAGVPYQFQRQQASHSAAWLQLFSIGASQQDLAAGPLPVSVTVAGRVNALCPAQGDYYSLNACQYVLHGGSGCCPRGLTATGMVHRRRRLTGMAAAHGVHPGQPLFAMGVAKAAA